MPSVKLASLAVVTVRLARFQHATSTAVLPAPAVKLCVPSDSVAPTGKALTTNEASALASPARPLMLAPRERESGGEGKSVDVGGARISEKKKNRSGAGWVGARHQIA